MSRRTVTLGSNSSCGDVGGAMLGMVVVVHMVTSPNVLLFIFLFLTLGATLHGVHVVVSVGVRVGQQRGRGRQLLQSGMCVFNSDRCLPQQVNGMGQSGQDELKTLLEQKTINYNNNNKIK